MVDRGLRQVREGELSDGFSPSRLSPLGVTFWSRLVSVLLSSAQ